MAGQRLIRQQGVGDKTLSTGRSRPALLGAPAFALMLLISACSTGTPTAIDTVEPGAGDAAAGAGGEGTDGGSNGGDTDSGDTDSGATAKSATSVSGETDTSTAEGTTTAGNSAVEKQATQPTTPGCSATSAADGVNVAWWGLSQDAEIDILGQGQVLIQTADKADGVLTLFGAPPEPGNPIQLKARTTDDATTFECGTAGTLINLPTPDCTLELIGGKPQLVISYEDGSAGPLGRAVIRDGESIEASFSGGPNPIDTSAEPGRTYVYQIEMSDSTDRDPVIGECGSITIPEAGDETTALVAAKDLFTKTAFGPHAYFTIVSLGDSQDYYMQADANGGRSFIPPLADSALIDPFTIHDELADAIAAEKEVSYQIDETSGLPTWWTVDDQTIKLTCFELDTAPPDLRVGPCDPETDFIGR